MGRSHSAAGLDYTRIQRLKRTRCLTCDDIAKAIRKRKRSGLPLTAAAVQRGPYAEHLLYWAACKKFGSWRAAIEHAALNYGATRPLPRSKYPLRADVVIAIRRRARSGLPLRCRALSRGPDRDRTLYVRGHRLFGTWSEALRRAGVRTKTQ